MDITTLNATAIAAEVRAASFAAADQFFQEKLGGVDKFACGFAWITIYPEHKGNTKAGRAERKVLEAIGARKDWTGKAYEIWNPSKFGCQNVDTLEAGAYAGAEVLRKYGFTAYAGSRLD